MSNPAKHLLRRADRQGHGDLSGPTGLSRLDLTERLLSAHESLTLDAGRERFLYVLLGTGELNCARQQAGPDDAEKETVRLNEGDFVALAMDEEAVIRADAAAMTLLFGQGPITPSR